MPYQDRKLSLHIYNLGPREAAEFPKKRVGSVYWAFFSLQKTVSSADGSSFFFQGSSFDTSVGQFNLSDTSKFGELSSSSLFCSIFRASQLLCQGTWEGGAVTKEAPAALGRNLSPLPLSLKSLHLSRWREGRESSISHVLSASQACPREGRERFQ